MPIEYPPVEIEQIKPIVLRALQSAFDRYNSLGNRGLEEIRKNQFGETALRMDIEAEEAILESFIKDKFPVRVISEEHKTVDIGNPQFLAVLDGIDGTTLYKKDTANGKYGTMLGIFQGTNPQYSDYLFGGIMQHATQRILIGIKGRGAFAISNNKEQPIHTAGHTKFDKNTKIYIDESFKINHKTFSEKLIGFNVGYEKASSLYYADVAEGLADFALECTRKGNLEIATAYGLIREAGGVAVDMNGNDIGSQKYLEFGQKKHNTFVVAATKELANNMISFLKK